MTDAIDFDANPNPILTLTLTLTLSRQHHDRRHRLRRGGHQAGAAALLPWRAWPRPDAAGHRSTLLTGLSTVYHPTTLATLINTYTYHAYTHHTYHSYSTYHPSSTYSTTTTHTRYTYCGRTLQAAALHLRHSLDSLVYHPTTLTILSPLTPLRPCTLYTYCGRYCRPPLCTYSTH